MASTEIFHLASPVNLNTGKTVVLLSDYFTSCAAIQSVKCHKDLTCNLSECKTQAVLSHKKTGFPAISMLTVATGSGEYGIVVKKSRKVSHKIFFNAHGHIYKCVQIAGSFNSWNPQHHYLHFIGGHWEIELEIDPGLYTYQIIADGCWMPDPSNPLRVDNGYGAYNSLLEIKTPNEGLIPEIDAEQSFGNSLVVNASSHVKEFVVLWQNKHIKGHDIFVHDFKALLTLPPEALSMQRSFLRVWAYNEFGGSNDLLIPLEYGVPVTDTSQLTRNDKEASVLYFLLVDRFCIPKGMKKPKPTEGVHPKQDFCGGNLDGVLEKLEQGYFDMLGIDTLWISPVVKNPPAPAEKNKIKTTGYHGYWPYISTAVDPRLGSKDSLSKLSGLLHQKDMNILLDYVSNHVHQDNPIMRLNPDWCTPLVLPDGSFNIGRWEDQRFSTWFDEFLPTLNFDKPEVTDTMTEFAVFWAQQFQLDGFRHDATKHVQSSYWRKLTEKLKADVMQPKGKRFLQIGESFGGREMLLEYINSGMMDSQFSFNLYYELRDAFAFDEVPFAKLAIALEQDLRAFGYHNLMGNITGNHDMPRFISYAAGALSLKENAEHEGWHRDIAVKDPIGYKKLSALTAFICCIPGLPVIYYGDEIGIPGGGDPDNRRPMRFDNLNDYESETLRLCSKSVWLRRTNMSLIYGSFKKIEITDWTFVFSRAYLSEIAYCAFNKSPEEKIIAIPVAPNHRKINFKTNFGCHFQNEIYYIRLTLPPHSFEVLTPESTGKEQQPAK
jgi:cyclomaltodextrinase / maltogenic alpha-amylase / neopullulanase